MGAKYCGSAHTYEDSLCDEFDVRTELALIGCDLQQGKVTRFMTAKSQQKYAQKVAAA